MPIDAAAIEKRALQQLLEKLRPVSYRAAVLSQHWIGGSDNEGSNYCEKCGLEKIAGLYAEWAHTDKEFFLDGGWEAHEADSCVHCEVCHALLEYTLTKYGVDSELDHYSRHMPRKGVLSQEEAYHIVAALEQLEWCDDRKRVARGVRIGTRALALAQKNSGTTAIRALTKEA